jgi:hypothetical protein
LTGVSDLLQGVADSWTEIEDFIDGVTGLNERVRDCLNEVDVPGHDAVNAGSAFENPIDGVRGSVGDVCDTFDPDGDRAGP